LSVGATLHLAAGQAAGAYSGGLTLTCVADDGNPTDDATIAVLVTLLAPISISNTGELAFGTAAPTGVGGTITVAPDSGRTAVNVDLLGGTVSAASFTVGGEAGTGYTIAVAPATLTITDGGVNNMDVDAWTTAPTSPATLSGAPPDSLTVGATLNVGANQAPGVYSGTFSVTAEYN
jgi:spore coat protein U-like protein